MKNFLKLILFLFITTKAFSITSENFSLLRTEHISDDFKLVSKIDKGEHSCLKAVLLLNNEYFKRLLISDFKESCQNFMELPYSSKAISIILDFLYDKSKISLDINSLDLRDYAGLLDFADMANMTNLKEALTKIEVSFGLQEDELYLAMEIVEKYQDSNLLNQFINKLNNPNNTHKLKIDSSWLEHLIVLDFTFNPNKFKLSTPGISLDIYLSLQDQASDRYLKNLQIALQKIRIKINPNESLEALKIGIEQKNAKLIYNSLQAVKNYNPSEELIGILISEIENPLLLKILPLIKNSNLLNFLKNNLEKILVKRKVNPGDIDLSKLKQNKLGSKISAGYSRTCALTVAGDVRCWGKNNFGQNDVPEDLNKAIEITVGAHHTCILTVDKDVRCWGKNTYGEVDIPDDLGEVISIKSGYFHTCILTVDNDVRCWGQNHYGEIDVPVDLDEAIEITAGAYHTCTLTIDGDVRCWGAQPGRLSEVIEMSAGYSHTCALTADGDVSCWGHNSNGQIDVPKSLCEVIKIATGGYHSCALTIDGDVRCWGKNNNGEIDVPDDLDEVIEIAAGYSHTCAITVAGDVRCWGKNSFNQCLVPNDLGKII